MRRAAAEDGASGELLAQLGRRFAAIGHTAVVVPAVGFGVVLAPPSDRDVAVAVGGVVLVWSAVYAGWLLRGSGRVAAGRWLVGLDVMVVSLAATTAPWTVTSTAIDNGGIGWVVVFSSFSAVVLQLHVSTVQSIVAVVLIDCALLAGIALSPHGWTWRAVSVALWVIAEAALTRLLWRLVQRAGTRADGLAAQAEAAERSAAVAAARRQEERLYAMALHDTAASTLLMVGLGEVKRTDAWLAAQARRDLEALSLPPNSSAQLRTHVDLAAAVADVVSSAAVRVDSTLAEQALVPQPVSSALCGATREALNNVTRHARVDVASVSLEVRDGGGVQINVTDHGVGFPAQLRPVFRRGISGSIYDRLRDVGGVAEVRSSPGGGTTVCLVWPVAPGEAE